MPILRALDHIGERPSRTAAFVTGVILLFFLLRLPALDLPFFWDEMAVYGNAVFHQHDHGIGIQPKDLPPEMSRGHPMLYVFANSLISSVFGDNRLVLHLFNLLIACGLLYSLFYVAKRLFSRTAALLSLLILVVQPMVIAQSTLVLPEMSLALAVLWTVYAYLRRRWWLYVLAGVAAVWIKETAIIIPGALGLAELIRITVRGERLFHRSTMGRLLLIALPWLGYGAFLVLQKAQNGWYFFPYHAQLMDWRLSEIVGKTIDFLLFLFVEQGRVGWLPVLLAAFLLRATRGIGDWREVLKAHHTGMTLFLVVATAIAFSSTTAYMNRYMLFLLPLLSMSVAWLAWRIYVDAPSDSIVRSSAAQSLALVLLIILPLFFPPIKFTYDEDRSFRHQTAVMRQLFDRMVEDPQFAGKAINSNFPMFSAFEDSRYGYFEGELPFTGGAGIANGDYLIWMSPGSYNNPLPWSELDTVLHLEVKGKKGTVYRRKSP